MAKPEWGMKRMCLSCGSKFYDLQRSPIVCPSCSSEFNPDAAVKLKRGRPAAAEKSKPAKESKESDVELLDSDNLEESLEENSSEDVLEDTSDLDDGGDVPVVSGEEGGDDES